MKYDSHEGRDEVELAHPAIITVCGLSLRKGIPDLIEAFELTAAGYPSAKFYIVGKGQDRAQFVVQATASPFATRIIFSAF